MVSTNMTNNMKVTCFVKSASEFAREALNTVGHSSYTSGCLSHALQVRGTRDHDHLQITGCRMILTSLLLSPVPITLQDAALAALLPDWLRMSSVLIRKLRNLAKVSKFERREKQMKLSEKEE